MSVYLLLLLLLLLFIHFQIFFLVNFRYVAKVFYLKIGESSYSA